MKLKDINKLNFKVAEIKEGGEVCLTIGGEHLKGSSMIGYSWDNSHLLKDDKDSYVNFDIYNHKFLSISANKDINKGLWDEDKKKFIEHTDEQFLCELRKIYFILKILNKLNELFKIRKFFRHILIHLQENSRYSFNHLYVLDKLNTWDSIYKYGFKGELKDFRGVLGKSGDIIKQRDFKVLEDADLRQIEGEYNSFLSRLSEDRKRHSIGNLFSESILSDLADGYLRPIKASDLNLCEKTHKDVKSLVNNYNKELTGGTYSSHLNNYEDVVDYVTWCYNVYLLNKKTTESLDTVNIESLYIGCPQSQSLFTETKYFPKVADVLRETSVTNKDSIRRILNSFKQPIEMVADTAVSILRLAQGFGYELSNIQTNGKNRLSITVNNDYNEDMYRKEMRAMELVNANSFPTVKYEDLKGLFIDGEEVVYDASMKYYRDNDFNVSEWMFSGAIPDVLPKEQGKELMDLISDLEDSCSSVISLKPKQVELEL